MYRQYQNVKNTINPGTLKIHGSSGFYMPSFLLHHLCMWKVAAYYDYEVSTQLHSNY